MSVDWSNETDGAVKMLVVVPTDEVPHPTLRFFKALEWLFWVERTILERSKERLREGIVIADTRSSERRDDAQTLKRGYHRRALHWRAIV
jgi:hypothetical protein